MTDWTPTFIRRALPALAAAQQRLLAAIALHRAAASPLRQWVQQPSRVTVVAVVAVVVVVGALLTLIAVAGS